MKHSGNRLPPHAGQQVRPGHVVTIHFEGRPLRALVGDTVASALYAAGRRIFSRSFKYHRPRGLLCCSGDCPNCLMEIDGRPNVRACRTIVHDGLRARSQHGWPSIDHDFLRLIERFERLLPIGFYYKTLYKPRTLWKIAEPLIRRLAGLGRVSSDRSADSDYEHRYEYADVMVVGGGPAGIEAARNAAATGALVLLVEAEPQLGGHLRYEARSYSYEGSVRSGHEVARALAAMLSECENVRVIAGATAFGSYEGGLVAVLQDQVLIHVRTKALIIASGCHQYPAIFCNNDLPGVMLSRAALRLINLFAINPGKRAVVITSDDDGYLAALESLNAGIEIAEVVDARQCSPELPEVSMLRAARVKITTGMAIREAIGSRAVSAVKIGPVNAADQVATEGERTIVCDLVLLSTAWQGNVALLLQSGCQLGFDKDLGKPIPVSMAPGVFAAGELLGLRSLSDIIRSGQLAAEAAVTAIGNGKPDISTGAWWEEIQPLLSRARRVSDGISLPIAGKEKNFVCLCEDVVEKDLRQGVDEGFDEIETLKRYSTVSMGPCQGRMCSRSSAEICGHATNRDLHAVGITTARPPVCPVPLGVLGGPEFHPVKRTSMHYKHLEATDQIMDMGVWKRPFVYTSVAEEYEAVRNHAGLIDLSTLGKLIVKGKDAPALLDKVYTHWFSTLEVGRVRYGVMCDESGTILDDGTVARLAADHYYITTSTGNVDFVEQWMKWWATGTNWCVHILNVTAGTAAVNLAGPQARDILARVTDLDVSKASFPYLACREGAVAGIPSILLRVGFVGETGWEIHFPAEYGEYLWDVLLATGEDLQIRPFGVETQRLLRLEKKHIIVGQDTDALSNPYDSDMKWAVKLEKPDFVGRHALLAIQSQPLANRLVGFQCDGGCHPSDGNAVVINGRIAGRVTSVRFSPQLSRYVGMACIPTEYAKQGSRIGLHVNGTVHQAVVTEKPFYDPDGSRLK
jgi:sarcosine oxidase, subunit alpha